MDRDLWLMAYLDGELEPAERTAFERELAGDAGLQGELARQRGLRERLSRTYDPILEEPVQPGLVAIASAANAPGRAPLGLAAWAGMAATLVLGALIGLFAMRPTGRLVAQDGALVARGELARALTTQRSAEGGATKVTLSFRTQDGRYCRAFEDASVRLAGVACRDEDRWVARTLTVWSPPPQTAYRTAGSQTPAPVLAAVDEMIAGQPLDAAAEARAKARGWRP